MRSTDSLDIVATFSNSSDHLSPITEPSNDNDLGNSVAPSTSNDSCNSIGTFTITNNELVNDMNNMLMEKSKINERIFLEKVINVLENELTSNIKSDRDQAIDFLAQCFGDMLNDYPFIRWLAKKLGKKPCRLQSLLRTNISSASWTPRNSLAIEQHKDIYNFWKENGIVSVDRRNGRDKINISKIEYLRLPTKCIDDENIKEEKKLNKKSNIYKQYFSAQRMVQPDTLDKLSNKFKQSVNYDVSKSTFNKYKPFYIVPATEREKESCLCGCCLNIHCLMKGINKFANRSTYQFIPQ